MRRGLLNTGDTNHLVTESRVVMDCVHQRVFRACGFDADRGRSAVGPYPLLQYLPAIAMRRVGLRPRAVLRGLAWINFAAFVTTLGLLGSVAVLGSHRMWRSLLVMLAASGPLWFYATTGFGEMLVAVLVLAAVLACLHRRPVLVAMLALAACLGKETLPPFVLALGLLAGRGDDDGWLPPRRVLGPLLAGVLGGTTLSLGFNVFRYGTVRNVRYLQPQFRTHGVMRIARNVVELIAAPGGGLAPYWPAMVLLLVGLGIIGVGALRAGDPCREIAGPVAALFVVFGAFAVGLALWWAPFGWIAWGPRLFVPLIPAVAVVAVHVGGLRLTELVRRSVAAPVVFAGLLVVCVGGAFPELSAPWFAGPAVTTLRQPDSACPTFGEPGDDHYWRCVHHRAWRLHDNPLRTATRRGDAVTWLARVAGLGGIALLMLEARRSALEEPERQAMTATMSPEPTA